MCVLYTIMQVVYLYVRRQELAVSGLAVWVWLDKLLTMTQLPVKSLLILHVQAPSKNALLLQVFSKFEIILEIGNRHRLETCSHSPVYVAIGCPWRRPICELVPSWTFVVVGFFFVKLCPISSPLLLILLGSHFHQKVLLIVDSCWHSRACGTGLILNLLCF